MNDAIINKAPLVISGYMVDFVYAQLAGASEGPFLQMIKRYWIEKDI